MTLTPEQVAYWFSPAQEFSAALAGVKIGMRACTTCGSIVPDTDDGHWLALHVRHHQRQDRRDT